MRLLMTSLLRSNHCDANAIQGALQTTFAGTRMATTSRNRFPTQGDTGGGMADTVALLQQLGFGGYEARAYIALLQRNPLNGDELAKASGVPRSNVYTVLQKLEERGAVARLEMPAAPGIHPSHRPQHALHRHGCGQPRCAAGVWRCTVECLRTLLPQRVAAFRTRSAHYCRWRIQHLRWHLSAAWAVRAIAPVRSAD